MTFTESLALLFYVAAYKKDFRLLEHLKQKFPRYINQLMLENPLTPLLRAVERKNLPLMQLLLTSGADVNFALPSTGATALMFACYYSKFSIIKSLLSFGAGKKQNRQ